MGAGRAGQIVSSAHMLRLSPSSCDSPTEAQTQSAVDHVLVRPISQPNMTHLLLCAQNAERVEVKQASLHCNCKGDS